MITIRITLTQAGAPTGPFDLYYNFNNLIENDVDKSLLLNGYEVQVPESATSIRVQSDNVNCNNYIDIIIPQVTTSTTTTSTTTTSTTTTTTTATRNMLRKCSDDSTNWYLSPSSLYLLNGEPIGNNIVNPNTRVQVVSETSNDYYVVTGTTNNLSALTEVIAEVTNDTGCLITTTTTTTLPPRNRLQRCSDNSTNWYLSPESMNTNNQQIGNGLLPNNTRIETISETPGGGEYYIVIGQVTDLTSLTGLTATVTSSSGCGTTTTTQPQYTLTIASPTGGGVSAACNSNTPGSPYTLTYTGTFGNGTIISGYTATSLVYIKIMASTEPNFQYGGSTAGGGWIFALSPQAGGGSQVVNLQNCS